eukprot:g9131.t1
MAPLNMDGVCLFRLTRMAKTEHVQQLLLNPDGPLAALHARVLEAGCEVNPDWSPVKVLFVPITEAQMNELQDLADFGYELRRDVHLLALQEDQRIIEAAFRNAFPSAGRPKLKQVGPTRDVPNMRREDGEEAADDKAYEELLEQRAELQRKVQFLLQSQRQTAASPLAHEVYGPMDPENPHCRRYRRYWMEQAPRAPRPAPQAPPAAQQVAPQAVPQAPPAAAPVPQADVPEATQSCLRRQEAIRLAQQEMEANFNRAPMHAASASASPARPCDQDRSRAGRAGEFSTMPTAAPAAPPASPPELRASGAPRLFASRPAEMERREAAPAPEIWPSREESPKDVVASMDTSSVVDSRGAVHLMRSQPSTNTSGGVKAQNPYHELKMKMEADGQGAEAVISAVDRRETSGSATYLRWLIPSSATVVLGLLAALLYRCTKRWPEQSESTEETQLKEWSSGYFDCFSDLQQPSLAETKDTMDMANIIGYWPAAFAFLFLMASNFWLPVFVLVNVALLTYGRQMLRKGFDMKDQATAKGICGDCLYVSFCTPCAIKQEAAHVEKAAKANHPLLAAKRPLGEAAASSPPAQASMPQPQTATPAPPKTFSKKAEWGEDAHNWGALSKASFDPSEEADVAPIPTEPPAPATVPPAPSPAPSPKARPSEGMDEEQWLFKAKELLKSLGLESSTRPQWRTPSEAGDARLGLSSRLVHATGPRAQGEGDGHLPRLSRTACGSEWLAGCARPQLRGAARPRARARHARDEASKLPRWFYSQICDQGEAFEAFLGESTVLFAVRSEA